MPCVSRRQYRIVISTPKREPKVNKSVICNKYLKEVMRSECEDTRRGVKGWRDFKAKCIKGLAVIWEGELESKQKCDMQQNLSVRGRVNVKRV